mmetsp:Transcript_1336/g.3945  ORF Transcript_1336/g.3945 Transcript_1336/m.3945 type:complete len:228 (+) Transcript_1336:63-746(+)
MLDGGQQGRGRPGEQGRGAAGREEEEVRHRDSALEEGRREGGLDRAREGAGGGDRARPKGRHFGAALREAARRRPLRCGGGARLFGHHCGEARAAPARHARVGLRGGHALAHGSGSCEALLARRWRRHGQERRRGRVAGTTARQRKRRGVALLQAHRAGAVRASDTFAVAGGHALRDGRWIRGGAARGRRRRQRDGQGRRALPGADRRAAAKRRGAPRRGRRPRIDC